jgi:L-lactate utilization protein LutC
VRQAVKEGNRPGAAAPLEPRGRLGYQGAGSDPLARFGAELSAAGGTAHLVADAGAARAGIADLVRQKGARKVLLSRGTFLDSLHLAGHLRQAGVELIEVDSLLALTAREPLFAADLGISGVDYLVAETGTVVIGCRPGEPRSVSLLPPVHVAVARRDQLVPDLFDLFGDSLPIAPDGVLPSCLTLITGPSKTGDIELKLVTGVHGPRELHVVLVG